MIRMRAVVGAAAVSLLAAGCGNSPPPISSGAADVLHHDVRTLTAAIAAQQWNSADHALAQLRADLAAAANAGAVTSSRLAAIQADVASVQADLAARREAHPPLPPLTTSPKPTPKPGPEPKPKPKPKPKPPPPGHDHGHGHGGGGEGGD